MSELDREAIRAMRRSYGEVGLENLPTDPFAAFSTWLKEAAANDFIVEANAMVLSTLGSNAQGHDAITTEVREAPTFYYAEEEHQQYLSKNPGGYCGLGGTGVAFCGSAFLRTNPVSG